MAGGNSLQPNNVIFAIMELDGSGISIPFNQIGDKVINSTFWFHSFCEIEISPKFINNFVFYNLKNNVKNSYC